MRRRSPQTVRFFNPPGLPHVRAVHGEKVVSEFRRHVHDGFCIGIVRSGARVIYQGGASTIIPENALFVINPGESHGCASWQGEHSYSVICVDAEYMKTIASQISGKTQAAPYFRDTLLHDRELGSGIRRFFSLIENEGLCLERESLLRSLLSTLILKYGNEPPRPLREGSPHDAIKRVRELIRTCYGEDLSLRRLSRAAGLSPFYLQRLFLKHTGVSPHDYLLHVRIRKAQELLTQGHTIVDAALHTGFVDQSHFTRSFLRVTGITPGNFVSPTQGRTGQYAG